jgi:transposase InsO family protein
MLRIRHIRTRPYTPKTNGKAGRFIQTLLREWAYAIPFGSSGARAADLPRWPTWYNQQRPHGDLSRRTPTQALAGTT